MTQAASLIFFNNSDWPQWTDEIARPNGTINRQFMEYRCNVAGAEVVFYRPPRETGRRITMTGPASGAEADDE